MFIPHAPPPPPLPQGAGGGGGAAGFGQGLGFKGGYSGYRLYCQAFGSLMSDYVPAQSAGGRYGAGVWPRCRACSQSAVLGPPCKLMQPCMSSGLGVHPLLSPGAVGTDRAAELLGWAGAGAGLLDSAPPCRRSWHCKHTETNGMKSALDCGRFRRFECSWNR